MLFLTPNLINKNKNWLEIQELIKDLDFKLLLIKLKDK